MRSTSRRRHSFMAARAGLFLRAAASLMCALAEHGSIAKPQADVRSWPKPQAYLGEIL